MTQRYRVELEFLIDRRVGWSGEHAVLHDHLESVVARLAGDGPVEDTRFVVDPTNGTLALDVVVTARDLADAERATRVRLAAAIQESGAVHHGLLSLREESEAKSKLNAWAGLRTPQWRHRKAAAAPL